MKAKFVYEAMRDILKPKSEEEILVSMKNLDPNKSLKKSSRAGFLPGVKKALGMGADVHTKNNWALQQASGSGRYDIVELLLKHGADIHDNNDFALRVASSNGHYNIVELLLKHGADVHAQNNEALTGASNRGHKNIVELLKKWMNKHIKESIGDILKPKSETEILNNIVDEIINNYETISISLIHSRGESNLKILNNVGNHFFDRWRSIHGKGIIISVDDSDIEKFEEILYKLEIVYNKIGYSTVLIKDDTKEREIFIELVKTMFKQEFVHFITKKI